MWKGYRTLRKKHKKLCALAFLGCLYFLMLFGWKQWIEGDNDLDKDKRRQKFDPSISECKANALVFKNKF